MEIKYLASHPEFKKTVADWLYAEFVKDIRRGISYDQLLTAVSRCNKYSPPIKLIALYDGVCAGTVSLVKNDLSFRDYEPWLASLYVDPKYRGNKIAEQLIERVKDISRGLGYKELYLRTEFAGEYYRKRGWTFVESCICEYKLKTEVFKVSLDNM